MPLLRVVFTALSLLELDRNGRKQMPLIEVRRHSANVHGPLLNDVIDALIPAAARALTCAEGGKLANGDIMVEASVLSASCKNVKDIHIRVIAHDYPSRRERLEDINKDIASAIRPLIPEGIAWYVWTLLVPTAYVSDSE